MKKLGLVTLLVGLVFMLSGCVFFANLTAEATIENYTDKTFVCMANYNSSLSIDSEPWELAPGMTKVINLAGHFSKADYIDTSEYFDFYYMEKDIYETTIAKNNRWSPWYTLTNSRGHNCVKAIDKRSQSYKVVFKPTTDGTDNYTVEVTW